MKRVALAGLIVLAVAAPAHAADLRPCPDSPTARCGSIVVPAVRSEETALALERGRPYLAVDTTDASRAVRERMGFAAVAATTPSIWSPVPLAP